MNRRVAFPFLTLSEPAVVAGPWSISLDGSDWLDARDHLPDWDPSSALKVRRTIRLESAVVLHDLSIPEDYVRLSIGVRVGTGQGRLPRMILVRERCALEVGTWAHEFEINVPGHSLSIVLDLLTEVTLSAIPENFGPLSPRHIGDRIWQDTVRLRLEGEEPRFPMETVDLAALLGDAGAASAPWYLHWSPRSWDRDFHGGVRLYLNKSRGDFVERIEGEDGPTLEVLLADVMGQICERFILDPEVSGLMDAAEPGSLGAQAATWLRHAWPGKDPAFIRSILESQPGSFRAAFLALAELGEA